MEKAKMKNFQHTFKSEDYNERYKRQTTITHLKETVWPESEKYIKELQRGLELKRQQNLQI